MVDIQHAMAVLSDVRPLFSFRSGFSARSRMATPTTASPTVGSARIPLAAQGSIRPPLGGPPPNDRHPPDCARSAYGQVWRHRNAGEANPRGQGGGAECEVILVGSQDGPPHKRLIEEIVAVH